MSENLKYEYCKNPKNSDTRKNAVITLKFAQGGFTIEKGVQKVQTEWLTVQTLIRLLLKEQSDLGLLCLPRPDCPKT